MNSLLVLGLVLCVTIASTEDFCDFTKLEAAGRVVFGEARGQNAECQLAVAYTIVNRVNHPGYPDTLNEVVYQKIGTAHQYSTLDVPSHTRDWEQARQTISDAYNDALSAASGALCGLEADPTICATAYCAHDPCSATSDSDYSIAYNKTHIGSYYFVCRQQIAG